MIQCNECGFGVDESMKFALMQNICPSCGSALFSNKDSNIISMIQGKLASQRFAGGFSETMLYDVTLFVFNELKYGLGRELAADLVSKTAQETDVEYSEDEAEVDEEELIRREVEREYAEELNQLANDGSVETEEIFSKAERLKRMHQQRVLKNPNLGKEAPFKGPKNGFKGINRVS